jgi:ribosomal protein S18 acetylase RimI-like enzyme
MNSPINKNLTELSEMECVKIGEHDYGEFHGLTNSYYREGEDENTPQEVIDSFVRLMFDKVINNEIYGCFVKDEHKYIGFALWAVDTEDFAFSEMPGFGTILEIGLIPSYRASGLGKNLVTYIENSLQKNQIAQCYVSAYGPAQKFWASCGYVENGSKASNGLPIMIKTIV